MDAELLQSVSRRLPVFDRQSKEPAFDFAGTIQHYSWVQQKDGKPQLRLAKLNAVEPSQRLLALDDDNAPVWAITTTFDEDRDGDIVVPSGIDTADFARNPVVFFGHQELALPIAKGVDENGQLMWLTEENRCRGGCIFDPHDADAMFIRSKVLRGYLNGVSIAFVPIQAFKRGGLERHKAEPRHEGDKPLGWVFEKIGLTEWSWVGVQANAGAIRDSLDREKSFISPRCQKVYGQYAAKSINEKGGCFTGWCCPCEPKKSLPVDAEKDMIAKDVQIIPYRGKFTIARVGENYPIYGDDALFDTREEAFAWARAQKINPVKGKAMTVRKALPDNTPITDISGGRGRFDGCTTLGQLRAKLRSGEKLILATYGGKEQLEVRGNPNPTGAQWDNGARGIIATAKIVKSQKKGCGGCSKSHPCGKCKGQRKESLPDCVARKIPIFMREHPDWDQKRAIAAAYGYCGEGKAMKGERRKGDRSEKSEGHVGFIGDSEYYIDASGSLYKAKISGDVMTDGYRSGRWECGPNQVEQRLRMLGLKKGLATTSGTTGGYTVGPTKNEVMACYTRALATGVDPAAACGHVERKLGVRLDVRKDWTLRGFTRKALAALQKGRKRIKKGGDLMDYNTGRYIRPATDDEERASDRAGPEGVIRVNINGKPTDCYVEKSNGYTVRHKAEDPEDEALEHETDVETIETAMEESPEDFAGEETPEEEAAEEEAIAAVESAPPLAMALAAAHQHHMALKDYLDEQKDMLERSKAGMEPEHHAVVDQHIAALMEMAEKAEESANGVGEMFTKRYPETDMEQVKALTAGPSPNQGQPEGLEGEDGYTAMDEDYEDDAVEMDEDYVSMSDDEEEVKGEEDAEEILARYREQPKGGRRGVRKEYKVVRVEGGYTVVDSQGRRVYEEAMPKERAENLARGLQQSGGKSARRAVAKAMSGVQVNDAVSVNGNHGIVVAVDKPSQTADVKFNNGHIVTDVSFDDLKWEGGKSARRAVAKGSTCMSETHELLRSLAGSETDPVKRAALEHHAEKMKAAMGAPSGGPPKPGMEPVARALEGEGMEELDEDEEVPEKSVRKIEGHDCEGENNDDPECRAMFRDVSSGKSNKKRANGAVAKKLTNGVALLSKDASALTDGLAAMKRNLGI